MRFVKIVLGVDPDNADAENALVAPAKFFVQPGVMVKASPFAGVTGKGETICAIPGTHDLTLRVTPAFAPDVNFNVPLLKKPAACANPQLIVEPETPVTVDVTAIDVRLNVQFESPNTHGQVG